MRTSHRALGVLSIGVLLAASVVAPAQADDLNVPPSRSIVGSTNTGLSGPLAIEIGPNGKTYVTNFASNSISVFASNANGDVAPQRRISGPTSTLTNPRYLDVDKSGYIWVPDDTKVKSFAPTANGDVAPASSFETGMNTFGLAIAPNGKIFVGDSGTIKRFSPSATGPASVERTITGAPLSDVRAMDVDRHGRVWVANGFDKSVLAIDPNSSGSPTVLRQIKGSNTGITHVDDVAVDRAGRIYIVDEFSKTVRVFASNANGNVEPIKVLGGPATGLAQPAGIAVRDNLEILVANYGSNAVLTFNRLFAIEPSAPRSLKVSGSSKSANRTISWKSPSANGGAAITQYRIVVKKGSKTLVTKTVSGSTRSYTVNRSKLRNGTNKVLIHAKNSAGWGKTSTKTFQVKK